MEKTEEFPNAKFSRAAIVGAYEALERFTGEDMTYSAYMVKPTLLEQWRLDTPDEFFAMYEDRCVYASLTQNHGDYKFDITYSAQWNPGRSTLAVQCPSRAEIDAVFNVLESGIEEARRRARPPVRVFIGHGRDPQWRDLKDHLHEQHGYEVDAYEIGTRAGLDVREVLQSMLERATFALLVMTAEDEHADETWHARDNVIHEAGLFQGRLGFTRAIVLLEEGTTEFSNIGGVTQVRFTSGHIAETFGGVLATLRREFG